MLLSVMSSEEKLAEAAKGGADTIVLEQILHTISTWPALQIDSGSSSTGTQPTDSSEQASAVHLGPIPDKIAASLPLVAAAHLLSTMVYNHRRIAHGDRQERWFVQNSRATQIAFFCLSSCSHAPFRELPKPVEEDPHKEHYHMLPSRWMGPSGETFLDWLQQNRASVEIDVGNAVGYQNSIADITADATVLQLGQDLQQCQKLAEDWFDSTQNEACKSLVIFLVGRRLAKQSTQSEWDASVRQVSRQLCMNSTRLPGHMTQLMTHCCSTCYVLRNMDASNEQVLVLDTLFLWT